VRFKRLDLDSALAEGANPETTEGLALRAQQLRDPKERQRLATAIENLFRLATMGPGVNATTSLVRAPFNRYHVAANRPGLEQLALKLRGDGRHGVRGLAMASILIEDAGSPLYTPNVNDQLKQAIREASSALDH
jgi:hypothetical protein